MRAPFRHASGGKPALRQVCSRKVTRLQPCSTGTCGSKSPRWRPWETTSPWRPISISSGEVGCSGERTLIEIRIMRASSRRTGGKRGSSQAAARALSITARYTGRTAAGNPTQPRSFRSEYSVVKTPRGSAKCGEGAGREISCPARKEKIDSRAICNNNFRSSEL